MTDTTTDTEAAPAPAGERPDLEGMARHAQWILDDPLSTAYTLRIARYVFGLIGYVHRLEATNTRLNRRVGKLEKRLNRWGASREYSFSLWWHFIGSTALKRAVVRLARQNGVVAELRHSNASLLAANVEEMARADKNGGWEYRALAAEAECAALRAQLPTQAEKGDSAGDIVGRAEGRGREWELT